MTNLRKILSVNMRGADYFGRRRKWKMLLEMGFEELGAGDVLSIHWLCQPLVNTVPAPEFHKNKRITGLCARIFGYIP